MDELTGEDGKIDREKLGTYKHVSLLWWPGMLMAAPIDSYDESRDTSDDSE